MKLPETTRERSALRKYVITGGPGAGKSTLLAELTRQGEHTLTEVAEYLMHQGIRPEAGRDAFQRQVLATQLAWERAIPQGVKRAYLDRGVPDGLAYYLLDGLTPPRELVEAAENADYTRVYLLEPQKEYKNTKIRAESPACARQIHEALKEVYQQLGLPLTIIPRHPCPLSHELRFSHLASFLLEHDAMRQPARETRGGRKE